MSKKLMKIVACCMIVMIGCLPLRVHALEQDGMTKVLKLYGEKKYGEAAKYNHALKRFASENCVKNMSQKMKQIYKQKVMEYLEQIKKNPDKWNVEYFYYYVTDLDNDQKSDLLIYLDDGGENSRLVVYMARNNKAVKVAETKAGDSNFYAYPDHAGIIRVMKLYQAHEHVSVLTLKGNKIIEKKIGQGKNRNDSFPFHEELHGHLFFDQNNTPHTDLTVFK